MSDLEVLRRGSVAVLRLNRPERHNAFGGRLFADLLEAAEAADQNDEVRSLVTTGAGDTYGVGADLSELKDLAGRGPIDLGELGVDGIGGEKGLPAQSAAQKSVDHLGIGRWSLRFRELGLPTVAAINGAAAGGAMGLALLHDVRIASTTAKFATGWIRIGLGPEMGVSWLLPRLLGEARAFDLLTRTQPVEAEEALELGLVEAVVQPRDLIEAATARAAAFATLPAGACRATKRILHSASESTFGDQLEREWMAQRLLFSSNESRKLLVDALSSDAHRAAVGNPSHPSRATDV
ncbi:enoyl-CoA hydratase/isomerase family protein [Mycobacterium sp. Aquia_216]|uniref:enoyl-CoA hydratase/isomerase family protein n=1 Tax=Mycobacterium sp. Aquia_216 TaxID=2991729 RepID=UPI00227B8C93|nr:enoyl-CoA hydratase/isomerase family protein [Mycobacterium sp. Aquia_216]WAJ45347.1 enoyl-CoA hydratase/isomerase family protein [Mycobacterium sp. Aquia_216]